MKRFATGVLIGLLLASLFSAPWIYQAWAAGNCAVFRTWNTGDSVTAGDLNSSFTTAAVTNSTPECVSGYSDTVSEMQATTDPYPASVESQATSMAGELERLRYVIKASFGLTHWYRHDQAPRLNNLVGHLTLGALHLGSFGHVNAIKGNDTYGARFPVLTGPDHWTGIFWPHATAHMAITIRDPNHATGGVQGGIELWRFHAAGMTFHHTVSLRFRHSEAQMAGGQRGHITALTISQILGEGEGKDRLILGHGSTTLQIDGNGITAQGAHHKALFVSYGGHVYLNSVRPDSFPINLYIQVFN
jgi:hypothetical protein